MFVLDLDNSAHIFSFQDIPDLVSVLIDLVEGSSDLATLGPTEKMEFIGHLRVCTLHVLR